MIPDLRNFELAHWPLLALLLLIPLLAALTYGVQSLRRPATLRYASLKLARTRAAFQSWRVTLFPLLKLLRWGALALLIFGLARPRSGDSQQVVTGEGVDIALALDISGSMASLDFQPDDRLTAAKFVIEEFVQERPFDRVGLVVFAQEAFAQSPLTVDHDVLGRLLQQVDLAPNLGLSDGTAIGMGLATAANMLKDSTAESKVIILLTDGVNNSGQIDPFTAAQAAQSLGIKVYTIGAGKPGQVPFPSINIFGETIVSYQESQLDEETLQQISDMTGALFFRAEDIQGLRQIYDAINNLEKSNVEIQTYNRYDELIAWVLMPALALLVLEMLLRQTIFRRLP